MSVDVSPDGETIVFDLLGDLYTMPMSGGSATRLTDGMAFDGQPRFSPDGSEVVFTSDSNGGENLWIIDLETEETRAVTEAKSHRYQSPEWKPDGDYIVVSRAGVRSGNHKLWMFHKDGGSSVQLVKEPDNLKTIGPAFGADARYVWYSQRTGDWQYNAIFPQYQLAVYDRDSGKRLTNSSRFGSAFRPPFLRMVSGWFMERGTTPKRACACATWRPERNAGWPTRSSATIRSPGRCGMCCPECRSLPIPRNWWSPTAGSSGHCRSMAVRRARFRLRLRSTSGSVPNWTSIVPSTARRLS